MLFDAENGQAEAIVIGEGINFTRERLVRQASAHPMQETMEKIKCIPTEATSVILCRVRCSRTIEFIEGVGLALLLR